MRYYGADVMASRDSLVAAIACTSITTDTGRIQFGTAFLVATDLVLTCAHCLDAGGGVLATSAYLNFSAHGKAVERCGTLRWSSAKNDLALLAIEPLPGVAPLPLAARPGIETSWWSFGFPRSAGGEGIVVDGQIALLRGQRRGNDVLELDCKQARTSIKGVSGSPVVVQGQVIGVISEELLDDDNQPIFNKVYAQPLDALSREQLRALCDVDFLPQQDCDTLVRGLRLLPTDLHDRTKAFIDEYMSTASRRVPFGGREQDLAALDASLDSTEPLLLVAPAGRGKSALLVNWASRTLAKGQAAVAFVPISIRFGTSSQLAFYQILASRLHSLYGVPMEIPLDATVDWWRREVYTLLDHPLPSDQKLLVIVDGLDEQFDFDITPSTFSRHRWSHVKFVVSFRSGPSDPATVRLLDQLDWDARSIRSVAALSLASINDIVASLSLANISQDVADELHRLSGGDPLLLRLTLDLVAEQGEQGVSVSDLQGMRPGIDGYFERWWRDQEALWKQHGAAERRLLCGAILDILSVARGPITREDLAQLVPSDVRPRGAELADALNSLSRFLVGDPNAGVVFAHPLLGDFFRSRLLRAELEQIEQRFIEWGLQCAALLTKGQAAPRYLFEHLREHLVRNAAPAHHLTFLGSAWRKASLAGTGDVRHFFSDLHQAKTTFLQASVDAVDTEAATSSFAPYLQAILVLAGMRSTEQSISSELAVAAGRTGVWSPPRFDGFIQRCDEEQFRSISSLLFFYPLSNELHQLIFSRAAAGFARAHVDLMAQAFVASHMPEKLSALLVALRSQQVVGFDDAVQTLLESKLLDTSSVRLLMEAACDHRSVISAVTTWKRFPEDEHIEHRLFATVSFAAKELELAIEAEHSIITYGSYGTGEKREARNAVWQRRSALSPALNGILEGPLTDQLREAFFHLLAASREPQIDRLHVLVFAPFPREDLANLLIPCIEVSFAQEHHYTTAIVDAIKHCSATFHDWPRLACQHIFRERTEYEQEPSTLLAHWILESTPPTTRLSILLETITLKRVACDDCLLQSLFSVDPQTALQLTKRTRTSEQLRGLASSVAQLREPFRSDALTLLVSEIKRSGEAADSWLTHNLWSSIEQALKDPSTEALFDTWLVECVRVLSEVVSTTALRLPKYLHVILSTLEAPIQDAIRAYTEAIEKKDYDHPLDEKVLLFRLGKLDAALADALEPKGLDSHNPAFDELTEAERSNRTWSRTANTKRAPIEWDAKSVIERLGTLSVSRERVLRALLLTRLAGKVPARTDHLLDLAIDIACVGSADEVAQPSQLSTSPSPDAELIEVLRATLSWSAPRLRASVGSLTGAQLARVQLELARAERSVQVCRDSRKTISLLPEKARTPLLIRDLALVENMLGSMHGWLDAVEQLIKHNRILEILTLCLGLDADDQRQIVEIIIERREQTGQRYRWHPTLFMGITSKDARELVELSCRLQEPSRSLFQKFVYRCALEPWTVRHVDRYEKNSGSLTVHVERVPPNVRLLCALSTCADAEFRAALLETASSTAHELEGNARCEALFDLALAANEQHSVFLSECLKRTLELPKSEERSCGLLCLAAQPLFVERTDLVLAAVSEAASLSAIVRAPLLRVALHASAMRHRVALLSALTSAWETLPYQALLRELADSLDLVAKLDGAGALDNFAKLTIEQLKEGI